MTIRQTLSVVPERIVIESTGEVIDAQRVIVRTETDRDFDKIWVAQIALAIELVGGASVKVLTDLMKHRNADNVVIKSQREIAESAGVDKATVNRTLKLLIEKELVVQIRGGVYQLSPGMIWRGTHDSRMRVLVDYQRSVSPPDPINAEEWAEREVADAQRRLEAAQRRLATARRDSTTSQQSPPPERLG
jgi:hypothetical protein